MERWACLLRLEIVINRRSHWVLDSDDPCAIDPPCSNNLLDVPDNSRPLVVDSPPLDDIIFADLVQKIQIVQFHSTEICWTVNGLVGGDWGYLTALRSFHSGAEDKSPTVDCKVMPILEGRDPENMSTARRFVGGAGPHLIC